jgi:uncharacterized protein (TIGR02001 family)
MMTHFLTSRARTLLASAALAALLATPSAVQAQEEEESFPQISGTAAFVSDYRWRGVSLSNKDPAVQASIQLTTKPGFFIAAWGSSIAEYGATFDDETGELLDSGATTEIDLYGGWSGPLGPLNATIGMLAYLHPGGSGVDAFEFYGTLGGSFGPASLTVGLNWAPDQKNLNRSNRYIFGTLGVAIPDTPITVKAGMGHERGSFVVDGSGRTTQKFDYLVGVDVTWKMLTLGGAFIGNDLPDKTNFNPTATNKFVVSLTAAF